MTGPPVDLTDPGVLLRAEVVDDPRPMYDVLRARAPVWQVPGQDTFLVSDPKLLREAVNRPEDFSSNLVSLLHDDGNGCPVAFHVAPAGDPIHVLATADPPIHTRHRKLLQAHLSPAAVAALEPAITRIVHDQLGVLFDSVVDGWVDAVPTFSDPVPVRTILELIGLPGEDADRINRLVGDTGALLDGVTELDGMSSAMHAAIELGTYVGEHLDRALGAAGGTAPRVARRVQRADRVGRSERRRGTRHARGAGLRRLRDDRQPHRDDDRDARQGPGAAAAPALPPRGAARRARSASCAPTARSSSTTATCPPTPSSAGCGSPRESRVLLMWAAAEPSGSRQSGAAGGGRRARAGAALRLRPRSALLHRRARRPPRGAPGDRAPARRDRPLRARPGASRRPTTEHLHPATRGAPAPSARQLMSGCALGPQTFDRVIRTLLGT